MQNKKQYPIGGFAPGNYWGECSSCGDKFQGDKRAFQCEPCGRTSDKLTVHIKEVLQFVSDKHGLGKTGEELLDEYSKHIYDEFIKTYRS